SCARRARASSTGRRSSSTADGARRSICPSSPCHRSGLIGNGPQTTIKEGELKCRAAVIRGVGRDWEIREIVLDPPRAGEVMVRMAVAGICHSDDHLFTGDVVPTPEVLATSGQPAPDWFPLLGGHEGAGVVEDVGPGVTTVQPGDHVTLSFIPACGNCRFCVNGQSYICD